MITMLYEKTLSRKVVSVSSKPIVEIDAERAADRDSNSHTNGNGVAKLVDPTRAARLRGVLSKPLAWMWRKKARKAEKKKDFASMGKILNLMR